MPEDMSSEQLGGFHNPLYQDKRPHGEPKTFEDSQVQMALEKAMAIQQAGVPRAGGEGYIDPVERMANERMAREAARGSWFIEGLRRTENPLGLRFLNRGILATWEERPKDFSEYTALSYQGILSDRLAGYKALRDIPEEVLQQLGLIGKKSPTTEEIPSMSKAQLQVLINERPIFNTDLRGEDLGKFIEELDAATREFIARKTILEVYKQQLQMAGDTKQYGLQFFIAPWRIKTETMHYGDIFRAEETLPGKENFGELVDKGMRGWIDITEGYANYIPEGETEEKKVPNPFDRSLVESELKLCREWIAKNRTEGDIQAVNLAYNLLRHLDMHVSFALKGGQIGKLKDGKVQGFTADVLRVMGRVENDGARNEDFLLPSYVELITRRGDLDKELELEASDTTNDTAKPSFWAVREAAEYSKGNPRAVAAAPRLMTIPNMTSDMMHMMVFVEIDPAGEKTPDDLEIVPAWKLWRDEMLPLGKFPWDQDEWEIPGRPGKKFTGIGKMYHHVPYGLQGMYSCGKVFESLTETDFAKMGEQIKSPTYLQELNKAYELAFAILWGPSGGPGGMSRETKAKLRQLVKVNMLAGYGIATSPGGSKDSSIELLKMPLAGTENARHTTTSIMNAANISGFFSTRDRAEGKTLKISGRSMNEMEERLLTYLIEDRRLGVKPSLLTGDAKGFPDKWFTTTEVAKMNELGIYAPFKA